MTVRHIGNDFILLFLFFDEDQVGIEMVDSLLESAIETSAHWRYCVFHGRCQKLIKYLWLQNYLLLLYLLVLVNVIVHQRGLIELIVAVLFFLLLLKVLLEFIQVHSLLILGMHPKSVYFASGRKLKVDFIPNFLDVLKERLHDFLEHITIRVHLLLGRLSYRSLRLVVVRGVIVSCCLLLDQNSHFLLQ